MADYSAEIQDAYDDIAEAGAVVFFARPATDETPADPDAPWEGNSEEPEEVKHVAVLLPLNQIAKENADSNHRALIPALNLSFEVFIGQEFRDMLGNKYTVTAISKLAPDPAQPILFDCECTIWPTAS